MHSETHTTDAKARLMLPASFANSTVIVEQLSESEIRIRRVGVIAKDDLPFAEEFRPSLSDRDRDLFLELIENPPVPNRDLRNAVKRHRSRRD